MIRKRAALWKTVSESLLIACLAGLPLLSASAQTENQPQNESQIRGPVEASPLVALKGNVHPLAQPRFDQGPAAVSLDAQRMLLVLRRSPRQEKLLQQYLASLEDRNSPDFQHFLTPEQFGRQFGPADADMGQVVDWLNRQGFSGMRVAKSKMAIEFSGSMGQITAAFHTGVHRFVIDGKEHLSNVSDPMIPAALAPVVAGVSPLNDFFLRSQAVRRPGGHWSQSDRRFVPDLTVQVGSTSYLFVGPGDAATLYNAPNLSNAHLPAGQAVYDGTGVTIGIATDESLNVSNVANYHATFGLPAPSISIVTDGQGLTYQADDTEPTLDAEIASGIATGAKIVYYQAGDTTLQSGVVLAMLRAVEDNTVNILNVSYGGCELAQGAAGNQEVLNIWEQAAAQGIAVTVSSGDSGSAGCDNPNTQTAATHGFAVNALASTPYTVAVGGTDFDGLPANFSRYVGTTPGPYLTTALGYIPESPWNESTSSNGASQNNQARKDHNGNTNIAAGGGGPSTAGLYDTLGNVLGGYAKPAWQQQFEAAAGIAADQVRDLPDVSLFASAGAYRAAWAICADNDCSGDSPTISAVGGTSTAAPAFAGILALINQKAGAGTRLGQPNWVLYSLAQSHPEIFHSITTGNISVVCAPGSPDCAGNGFLSGYDAARSYNLATGLGSVDIIGLLNNWASVARTQTSTTLSLGASSFRHGTSVPVQIAVTPASANGNVALLTDANERAAAIRADGQTSYALAGGQANGGWAGFPGGIYNVYASYAGDGTHAGSTSAPTQISVSPEDSVVRLSARTPDGSGRLVDLAGGTITYGTFATVDAQPIGQSQAGSANPLTNATGTVVFSDSFPGDQGGGVTLDATGNAEIAAHIFDAGNHVISAQYLGDQSYNQSQPASLAFNVSGAPTVVTGSSSLISPQSSTWNVYAKVEPATPIRSVEPQFGGSVVFSTAKGDMLGSGYLDGMGDGSTGFYALAAILVEPQQLRLGDNQVTAAFSGSANFSPATSSPFVITCTSGCGNGTGQSLELSFYSPVPDSYDLGAGTTSKTQVNVLGLGGFTGDVKLSCTATGTNSNDINLPQCSFDPATVTVVANANAPVSTLIVTSLAPGKSAEIILRSDIGKRFSGFAMLACTLLLGLPAHRRSRALLRVMVSIALLAGLGGLVACGGGGGGSAPSAGGSTGNVIPGTTPDTYTITFRAVDAATGTLTAEDHFKLQLL